MPVSLFWALLRPGFLLITAVGVLLGSAMAASCGCGFDIWRATAYGTLAILLHAAVNVLNDYADTLSGADQSNTNAIAPFTGGSGLLLRGRVSVQSARTIGYSLLILVAGGGVILVALTGPGLLVIGAAGLVLGWAYSVRPVSLMSRGLGEVAVFVMLWLLVLGADYVQRQSFLLVPSVTAVSFAILGSLILMAASFPDRQGDGFVGKRTLVVLMGSRLASWAYLAVAVEAYVWLGIGLYLQIQSIGAAWGFISAPLSLLAAVMLIRCHDRPPALKVPIVLTIAASLLHGLAMAAGLTWGGYGI
jgi:1,4-dihydroxy-2-naphthoate octaprenyltransferase